MSELDFDEWRPRPKGNAGGIVAPVNKPGRITDATRRMARDIYGRVGKTDAEREIEDYQAWADNGQVEPAPKPTTTLRDLRGLHIIGTRWLQDDLIGRAFAIAAFALPANDPSTTIIDDPPPNATWQPSGHVILPAGWFAWDEDDLAPDNSREARIARARRKPPARCPRHGVDLRSGYCPRCRR